MSKITIDAIHDADAQCFAVHVHAPGAPVFSTYFHYVEGSKADVIGSRRRAVAFLRGVITLHMSAPCLIINNDL